MSRRDLLEIYQAGIDAADGRRQVAATLRASDPGPDGVRLLAVGKSAPAMALGALDAWGPGIVDGLVITRHGYRLGEVAIRTDWSQLEASHPVPDETSLDAGDRLLGFLDRARRRERFLFLISGGSSSLVEVLPGGVTLEQLRQANTWLLGSGLDIAAVNAVRRRMSAIKDGRLAGRLAGHETLALYVSDVPGDGVWDIGSGLLARAPLERVPRDLPDWLEALLCHSPPPAAAPGNLRHFVVASLDLALGGCETAARRWSTHVVRHTDRLDLDVEVAAELVCGMLTASPPGIHLWGGETTVRLPPNPGQGGRNQHLALACALRLAGRDDVSVLCGATDGSDGPGEDAGGVVDGGTLARGELAGLDAVDSLARADAGRFLAAAGDLIHTGPTGTNVNDLVVGLKADGG